MNWNPGGQARLVDLSSEMDTNSLQSWSVPVCLANPLGPPEIARHPPPPPPADILETPPPPPPADILETLPHRAQIAPHWRPFADIESLECHPPSGVECKGVSHWCFQLESPSAALTCQVKDADQWTPLPPRRTGVFQAGLVPRCLVLLEPQLPGGAGGETRPDPALQSPQLALVQQDAGLEQIESADRELIPKDQLNRDKIEIGHIVLEVKEHEETVEQFLSLNDINMEVKEVKKAIKDTVFFKIDQKEEDVSRKETYFTNYCPLSDDINREEDYHIHKNVQEPMENAILEINLDILDNPNSLLTHSQSDVGPGSPSSFLSFPSPDISKQLIETEVRNSPPDGVKSGEIYELEVPAGDSAEFHKFSHSPPASQSQPASDHSNRSQHSSPPLAPSPGTPSPPPAPLSPSSTPRSPSNFPRHMLVKLDSNPEIEIACLCSPHGYHSQARPILR